MSVKALISVGLLVVVPRTRSLIGDGSIFRRRVALAPTTVSGGFLP